MLILAIEASGSSGSVALLDDSVLLREYDLSERGRTAQTLAPAIADLLAEAKLAPGDLDRIAVTQGPGSFTGLRVGVTTAKTLAYSTGAEICGVNTLDVIAAQAPLLGKRLWCVLDAQRQQVFTKPYSRDGDAWGSKHQTMILDNDRWMAEMSVKDAVAGPALDRLSDQLPSELQRVEPSLWPPRAKTVGLLSLTPKAEVFASAMEIVPRYYRLSAAEERAAAGRDAGTRRAP